MRALALCILLVACGGTKEPPKESTVTATKTDVPATPPPTTTEEPKKEEPKPKKKPAKEVIEGNTFMFSLADSPDAKKLVDESCKKAKKPLTEADCTKEAETSASGEGIRFENSTWISFGTEKGKEVVYNKVKYKIASEAEDKLTLTPDGKDEGKKPMKALPKEMVIEVVDESTVAMSDPKKGRLVFKKK